MSDKTGDYYISIAKAYELGRNEYDTTLRATVERVQAEVVERDALLERFGDAVTDMFEQMLKGKWRDDHDHDVRLNQKMIDLKPIVADTIALRARAALAPQ